MALFSDISQRPFDDPDTLVERLVSVEKAGSGAIGKLARELADEYVRSSKSLSDLVTRLREAKKGETDLIKIEALRYLRTRAESLEAVFPNL